MNEGLLVVISAPSGGGKGTILKELFAKDDNLVLSVSATTRSPRPGERRPPRGPRPAQALRWALKARPSLIASIIRMFGEPPRRDIMRRR